MRIRQAVAVMAAAVAVAGCGQHAAADPEFIISRAEFEQIFPGHSPFYTYDGLVAAHPGFTDRREAAMFLANVSHETGGLKYVAEQNRANYGSYCDRSKPYGCPAGQAAYYGRGPAQISWNYNYKKAGEWLGIDLLNDPSLIERDPAVAWKTGIWFWNTRVPHNAWFGETIRAFNGDQECDGGNTKQVAARVNAYVRIAKLLGVPPGDGLSC